MINLQNAVNNLPAAFTYYNNVMKSWDHVVNVSKRVEVPKKTIQTPSIKKRGWQKPLKRISLGRSDQERRRLKLLENPRM
jgi:hypothetical protein